MKPYMLRIFLLGFFILGISLLHYLTPLHLHFFHDIFQRFYYLPIILSAIWFGFRGGLACAVVVSMVYAPHILFQWGGGLVIEMEKYLEIVMYNIVGSVTGLLAQRERERTQELQRTAEGLEESYRILQLQSEKIIAIEEQLRRSEKLSTLGEMAAMLAHEIRNPLGSIRGTAEILRDDFRPGDPKHEFIEIQIKETERLNHVVEDFLRMARQQPIELSECSLREELETIMTLVAREAHDRSVFLSIEPGTDPYIVRGDGEKLRQAFLNIILNALQATPPRGHVSIAIKRVESGVEIRICDNGSGIRAEHLVRLFEPFFTTKADGTGLGLAVTRKIIEAHGGLLAVESVDGKGTTVVVTLPDQATKEKSGNEMGSYAAN